MALREATAWEVLEQPREVLYAFAGRHCLRVEPWYHDEPRWLFLQEKRRSDGSLLTRLVQVCAAEGDKGRTAGVLVIGTAYLDRMLDARRRERLLPPHRPVHRLPVPVEALALEAALERALAEARGLDESALTLRVVTTG